MTYRTPQERRAARITAEIIGAFVLSLFVLVMFLMAMDKNATIEQASAVNLMEYYGASE